MDVCPEAFTPVRIWVGSMLGGLAVKNMRAILAPSYLFRFKVYLPEDGSTTIPQSVNKTWLL